MFLCDRNGFHQLLLYCILYMFGIKESEAKYFMIISEHLIVKKNYKSNLTLSQTFDHFNYLIMWEEIVVHCQMKRNQVIKVEQQLKTFFVCSFMKCEGRPRNHKKFTKFKFNIFFLHKPLSGFYKGNRGHIEQIYTDLFFQVCVREPFEKPDETQTPFPGLIEYKYHFVE